MISFNARTVARPWKTGGTGSTSVHCYYEHDENPPEEKEPEPPKFNGPGFKEPWGSAGVGTVTHQQEKPRTMASPKEAPSPMRSLRGPGTAPALEVNEGDLYPTLALEKEWLYKISMFFFVLSCLFSIFGGLFAIVKAVVVGGVFMAALYYFLFEAPTWGKWGCLIYQFFSILGPILAFLMLSAKAFNLFDPKHIDAAMHLMGMGLFHLIFSVAVSIWIMTIMWRDIQIIKRDHKDRPEFMG